MTNSLYKIQEKLYNKNTNSRKYCEYFLLCEQCLLGDDCSKRILSFFLDKVHTSYAFSPNKMKEKIMSYKKGTPEYEAWKNSIEYKKWHDNIVASKAHKKGVPLSDSVKKKISKSVKEEYANLTKEEKQDRQKNNPFNGGDLWRGREHRKETKDKISKKAKERFANMSEEEREEFFGKYGIKQDTKLEKFFEQLLIEKGYVKGIDYEHPKQIGRYRVDFYLISKNLIVEIQGCFWHGCEQCCHISNWQIERREKDLKRKQELEEKGFALKMLWGHEILKMKEKDMQG